MLMIEIFDSVVRFLQFKILIVYMIDLVFYMI